MPVFRRKSLQRRSRSAAFYMNITMFVMIMCCIFMLVYMNLMMRSNIKEKVIRINKDFLELYMEQIDQTIVNTDIYLLDMLDTDDDIAKLQLETDSNERQLIKYAVYQDLKKSLITQADMDGFFIYSYNSEADEEYFNSVNKEGNFESEKVLSKERVEKKFTTKMHEREIDTQKWYVWKMDDSYYLFRTVYDRNTYLGCWVSLDNLMKSLEKINLEGGWALLTTGYGQILTENESGLRTVELPDDSSEEKLFTSNLKNIQISVASQNTDLYFVILIPAENILGSFSQTISMLLLFLLVVLLFIPGSGLLFRRMLYRPLQQLAKTMNQVAKGNMDIRQEEVSSMLEFQVLTDQFNSMMDEIQNLKIEVYEQKLAEKETYLQYLQLQIHPHFFLNCMNLMHGLAQLKRFEEIQKLSQDLVKYFRYMFKKAKSLICIAEELEHVHNYVEIQKMRFPDEIICEIESEQDLDDALIPPLSIQSFVENAVKYALNLPNCLVIKIKLIRLGNNIGISIRDNGKGYSADMLTRLNSAEELKGEEGDTNQIGIRNVKERFKLIFGDNSYIHFYNDHGSVTEFVLPCIIEKRNENVPGINGR